MAGNDTPEAWPVWTRGTGLEGFIKKHIHILLYTKYESSGPCGLREKDFSECVSHCKSMGAICCHGNQSFEPMWPKT